MQLKCDREKLSDALKIVGVAASSHQNTLPILGSVLLEASAASLRISATDLDIYASTEIEAAVEKDGATVVPYRLLSSLTDRVQDSKLSFNGGAKVLGFECGEVVANIETLEANEFPPKFEHKNAESIDCDSGEMLIPFAKLQSFIGRDPSRYNLMGINVAPEDGCTNFVATTGTRLAVYRGEAIAKQDAIISDVFVRALLKISPKGPMSVIVSEGVISVSAGRTLLSGKLIEGHYPNYRQVIPSNGSNIFGINRKELISAIRTCSLFLDREIGLRIEGKKKYAEVSKPGKAKAKILGSELEGQPDFAIWFNYQHMLETLSVLEKDDVRIQCSGDNMPLKIEEGPFLAVLVPVQPL